MRREGKERNERRERNEREARKKREEERRKEDWVNEWEEEGVSDADWVSEIEKITKECMGEKNRENEQVVDF